MVANFPRFTDLQAIAEHLSGDPRYSKLSKAIKRAGMAQSCIADLTQSQDCLDALRTALANPRGPDPLARSVTENALMMQASLLYARATSTSTKKDADRGSISIREQLGDHERVDHDAIVDVRNKALAHVYTQVPINNAVWHVEALCAVETDDGWRPAGLSRRIQVSKPFIDRLGRMIPIAKGIVSRRFHERLNAAMALMNDTPVPIAVFEAHLIDPVALVGNEEGVQLALDGMASGSAKGLIDGT